MKISLTWIKDYVSFEENPAQLNHKLTMAGIEVEKEEKVGKDVVFEVEITPNRPDCLSMLGLAREFGAILNKKVTYPKIKKINLPSEKCDITIEDKEACATYVATIIRDVDVKKTSAHILSRLSMVGLRSINNVVDITNFSLMENGQPLHAFDYDKLSGGKIIVRRAQKGETLITIDGITRELDESMLIIADAEKPVAIAGVMGGQATEVGPNTKNILLESAYFNPILIRRTSRKLGLSSDSSYRFERGVNFENVLEGALRATSLILEEAGGNITQHFIAQGKKLDRKKKNINITPKKINDYLGSKLSGSKIKNIFTKLGCEIKLGAQDTFIVSPPSFRDDLKRDVDLIEEVARVVGYDDLPASIPVVRPSQVQQEPKWDIKKRVRAILTALGMNEVVTFSMISQKMLDRMGEQKLAIVRVLNPLTQEQELMRPSLLANFLSVLTFNINRGQKDLKIFETGKVYLSDGEKEVLGVLMTGQSRDDWRVAAMDVDFFDVKGALASLLEQLNIKEVTFEKAQALIFSAQENVRVMVAGKEVGFCGRLDADILEASGIKQGTVYFAQINIEALNKQKTHYRTFVPIIEFPCVIRDVSLALNQDIDFDTIRKIIEQESTEILSDVHFKEQYLGDKIEKGKRGIVFSLVYQAKTRTLKEEEVNALHEKICQKIITTCHAIIR